MGLVFAGLAGCGGVEVEPGDSPDANPGAQVDAAPVDEPDAGAPDAAAPRGVVLRYDFEAPLIQDGVDLFVPDESGNDHLGAVTPGTIPGTVMVVARSDGEGNALMFPPPGCETDCPRVFLDAQGTEDLNPGEGDFAISLDLLVPPDAPGDENVAQKGFYDSAGGQWKIELSIDLRPICILRYGAGMAELVRAGLPRSINDGEWHTYRCARRGGVVEARLDDGVGDDLREEPIPDGVTVSIENGDRVLIGGQAGGSSSDQFYGILDNVQLEIFGPP